MLLSASLLSEETRAELHHRAPMCTVAVHKEEAPPKWFFSCELEQLRAQLCELAQQETGLSCSCYLHCNSRGDELGQDSSRKRAAPME